VLVVVQGSPSIPEAIVEMKMS